MTFKKLLGFIALTYLAFNLVACGGFDASQTTYGNNDDVPISPDTPGDLDTPPTGEPEETYDDEGDGVYLHDVHSDISALYEKTYFHADLGDVFGNQSTSQARQGGAVILSFEDDRGNKNKRYFSTGGSTYKSLEKNFWATKSDGSKMWRGIFQGRKGALIIIIDGIFQYGDGAGPLDTMAGSVWFRPWQVLDNKVLPTHECVLNSSGTWDCKNQSAPPRQCWYVSRGPYDCRFKIANDASYVTRLANSTNDTTWVKLGRFSNLNKSAVFHETY